MAIQREWWKEVVVYQVYPRSFNDSDGDGVGDIQGIVEKVDYLDDLGVDLVWLNPVYESPNADNGYDISDYRAIMDEFGTMADWETLLDELHERDIKLIMDLVVNHTSDEHEWFVRSRDADSDYHDFYMWETGDGEGEHPPNNWTSGFGGPAWEWDEEVGEWYLHLFDVKQPDLNWRNEAVRDEVFDMMEWWLEKGIDGFRMDVINLISKPEDLPDGDEDEGWVGMEHFANGPKTQEYLEEMYDRVLADHDVFTVGECVDASPEDAVAYASHGEPLSQVFHFDHVVLDHLGEDEKPAEDVHGEADEGLDIDRPFAVGEWELTELKEIFRHWQTELDGTSWNALYFSNHDQARPVSRFGDDGKYRRPSAKLLGTLLHTLQGTPYVYQGEELGMTNYPFQTKSELRDVDAINRIELAMDEGRIDSFDDLKAGVQRLSRDNARTPMQWSDGENAGFTDGDPWIDVNPNYDYINVEEGRADPDSVWHYYRDLISLRKDEEYGDVVVYGHYDEFLEDDEQFWVYVRSLPETGQRLLVTLNFSGDHGTLVLPESLRYDDTDLLLSNYDDADRDPDGDDFRPWEARVYALD